MKMKLVDEAIAMLPLTPIGMSGVLLIRSSVIVAALCGYFQLLGERAIPFGAANPESPLKPREQQILSMLVEGLAETSIAKRVGVSVTTVRRDMATIREKVGFDHHHFAAGAAAVRRGWIR